jgi:hypothetical protein
MVRVRNSRSDRRGVVLLVVITLLTLFAVVGLAFLLYAESQATSSRVWREAQNAQAPLDPREFINWALGQIIYDVPNDDKGVYSALRGHSLSRDMYGWRGPTGSDPWPTGGANPNTVPFSGSGRLRGYAPFAAATGVGAGNALLTKPNHLLVNYMNFTSAGDTPLYGLVRDPERLGTRASITAPLGNFVGEANPPYTYPDHNHLFLGARNADQTFVHPSYHGRDFGSLGDQANTNWTSEVGRYLTLRPRPEDMAKNSVGKLLFPFPDDDGGDVKNVRGAPGGNDSIWIDLGFEPFLYQNITIKPLFAIRVEDLDNRVNINVAGNLKGDTSHTGMKQHASNQGWCRQEINPQRLLKMADATGDSYARLFRGNGRGVVGRYGSPASDTLPNLATRFGSLQDVRLGRYYALQDYDAGGTFSTMADEFQLPRAYNATNPANWSTVPEFGARFQGAGGPPVPPSTDSTHDEQSGHPMTYSPYVTNGFTPGSTKRAFSPREMFHMLAYYGGDLRQASEPADSELYRDSMLALKNSRKLTNLITTISADLDRPGVAPWLYEPIGNTGVPLYEVATEAVGQTGGPATYADRFPQVQGATSADDHTRPFPDPVAKRPVALPQHSEFTNGDWRSRLAALGRIDLNRKLTPYPEVDPDTGRYKAEAFTNQLSFATADRQQLAKDIFDRLRLATGAMPMNDLTDTTLANEPWNDKVMAKLRPLAENQVFTNIMVDLDGDGTEETNFTGKQIEALRYLAQLAVNIVDYIDPDDVSTPFNWLGVLSTANPANPPTYGDFNQTDATQANYIPKAGWVYGVEQPRLVINEVFAQIEDDPQGKHADGTTPLTLPATAGSMPVDTTGNYHVNFWVELFNPMDRSAAKTLPDNLDPNKPNPPGTFKDGANEGVARLQVLDDMTAGNGWPVYQLGVYNVDPASVPATDTPVLRRLWNTRGELDADQTMPLDTTTVPNIDLLVADFRPDAMLAMDDVKKSLAEAQAVRVEPYDQAVDPQRYGKDVPTPEAAPKIAAGTNRMFSLLGPQEAQLPTNPKMGGGYEDKPFGPTLRVNPAPMTDPKKWTGRENSLQAKFPIQKVQTAGGVTTVLGKVKPKVYLRRLLNPYLRANDPRYTDTDPMTMMPTNCPYPWDPNLPYNPYITVDVFDMKDVGGTATVHDATWYTSDGKPKDPAKDPNGSDPDKPPKNASERASVGRRQPYRGDPDSHAFQAPSTAAMNFIKHTFFRHNGTGDVAMPTAGSTLDDPFTWLTHLDRQLTNPMELLTVASVRSHELTTEFLVGTGDPNNDDPMAMGAMPADKRHKHIAPWRKAEARIFRALELLGVRDRTVGSAVGGRVPGKININTVYDQETFEAIVDGYDGTEGNAQNSPDSIKFADAGSVFKDLVGQGDAKKARTPYGTPGDPPTADANNPDKYDRPFYGMAAPYTRHFDPTATLPTPTSDTQYPYVEGIRGTFLRNGGTPDNLTFRSPPAIAGRVKHPFIDAQMLAKTYGHMTTRSNVFAVWITVGFFQVPDPASTKKPIPLGEKVSDIKDIRFFCIVDRTNLSLEDASGAGAQRQGPRPFFFPLVARNPNPDPDPMAPVGSTDKNLPGFLPGGTTRQLRLPARAGRTGTGAGAFLEIPYDKTGYSDQDLVWRIDLTNETYIYVDVGPNPQLNNDPDYTYDTALNRMERAKIAKVVWDTTKTPPEAYIEVQLAKGHAQGCCISSAIPGNPGPQNDFDYFNIPKWRETVVPFGEFLP